MKETNGIFIWRIDNDPMYGLHDGEIVCFPLAAHTWESHVLDDEWPERTRENALFGRAYLNTSWLKIPPYYFFKGPGEEVPFGKMIIPLYTDIHGQECELYLEYLLTGKTDIDSDEMYCILPFSTQFTIDFWEEFGSDASPYEMNWPTYRLPNLTQIVQENIDPDELAANLEPAGTIIDVVNNEEES